MEEIADAGINSHISQWKVFSCQETPFYLKDRTNHYVPVGKMLVTLKKKKNLKHFGKYAEVNIKESNKNTETTFASVFQYWAKFSVGQLPWTGIN